MLAMLTALKFLIKIRIYIPIDTDMQFISQILKEEAACEIFVTYSGISRGVFVFSLVLTWQYDKKKHQIVTLFRNT